METERFKPYFVVIGLMALTSIVLAVTVDVTVTDEAGVKTFLPEQVGEWKGVELRFCVNPECPSSHSSFALDELKDPAVCSECGQPLDPMSFAEKNLLPADTVLLKKRYAHPSGRMLMVSIVLSGSERASIHRPEVCMVGQGNEIVHSYVLDVPLDSRAPLNVMVLDLLRNIRQPGAAPLAYPSYYAYWFVGKGRETPYHLARMFFMASDRIFKNVAHRWAYIAVSGNRSQDSEDYQEEIRSFLRGLYPQMILS